MLGLDFFLDVYLGFIFCVFFHVSLGHFVFVLLAFVVLGLVSSVLSQEIGWEHLQNDLFCVEWDVTPQLNQSITTVFHKSTAKIVKLFPHFSSLSSETELMLFICNRSYYS